MKKILYKGGGFRFIADRAKKANKVGKGHPIYIIEYYGWGLDEDEVRDTIDPKRNIGGGDAWRWKFKDLAVAEKKWTLLMLKWA